MAQRNIKKTTEEFIMEAQQVHGNKYEYFKVNYINNKKPVTIICPIHGEFEQSPIRHLKGRGCHKCAKERIANARKGKPQMLSQTEYLDRCISKYGNRYTYEKMEYKGMHHQLIVTCRKHGEFTTEAYSFLHDEQDCPLCKREKMTKNTDEFIKEAKAVWGDKYDYSKTEYINSNSNITIICPVHGEYTQIARSHLLYGCKKCYWDKQKLTQESFINKCKKIHHDEYDYSKVEYKGSSYPITIICHNKDRFGVEHGEFRQSASHHLYSAARCPRCIESEIESTIRWFLNENNINFEQYKSFKWLNRLSLDFYLPDYNIAIECQGMQHFKPIGYFGGQRQYDKQVKNDIIKRQLCENNNIKMLYYSNLGIDYPYQVYEDLEELLKEIKK